MYTNLRSTESPPNSTETPALSGLRSGHRAVGQDPGHLAIAAGLVETFAQVLAARRARRPWRHGGYPKSGWFTGKKPIENG